MSELPSLVQTNHPKVYGSSALETARYPGALQFDSYNVPKKDCKEGGQHGMCYYCIAMACIVSFFANVI
jgi:hypothetical protein